MKCLLGRTIGMWLNWRASWYLIPRDGEVNSGSIEKKRGEGNSVPLEKRASLILQFLSDPSLGVKPFFIVHFTLHNIILRSYFIICKCKDCICGASGCCEWIKWNCISPSSGRIRREVVNLYSCEGSKLFGGCVIVVPRSLPVTELVCVSLGRDILARISAVLSSQLWFTVVSVC